MSIGERIRFFRMMRGFTSELLGVLVGVESKINGAVKGKTNNAHARIKEYESGVRTPRPELLRQISEVLEVSPAAIALNVDSELGIMHTLFFLEDLYGFIPEQTGESISIQLPDSPAAKKWAEMCSLYHSAEISKQEYDNWRFKLEQLTEEANKEDR